MKNLKAFKNKTLRRKGYILVGDILLPVHTRGMMEIRKNMKNIMDNEKFPMKQVVATEEEKNALKGFGYNIGKFPLSIKRIDESSPEYKAFQTKMDKINLFIKIAINIDLEYPIDGGELLWEHLELKDVEDYYGMANWLSQLGMVEAEQQALIKTIDAIKNSNMKEYDDWSEDFLKNYKNFLIEDDCEQSNESK